MPAHGVFADGNSSLVSNVTVNLLGGVGITTTNGVGVYARHRVANTNQSNEIAITTQGQNTISAGES